jgi:predicted phage terminase large subunit-like protein
VFSQGGEATAKIAERVKRMASGNQFCNVDKANTRELSLVGGGRILFRTSNPGASRGLSSVHDILFDEWAFITPKGLDRTLWGDVTPSQEMVGVSAKIAVVSTPPERIGTQYMDILKNNNGDRDVFKVTRQMRDGELDPIQWWTDESGWAKFFIHWQAHPIFASRENHLEEVRISKKLDRVRLQREHNLNFEIKDGASLIDVSSIPRYQYPDSIPANPWLILQSWDTAQSDKPGSAKWAGSCYALYDGNIYLIDSIMRQMRFTEGLKTLKQFAKDHKPHLILIENKSSGADIIDALESEGFAYPTKAIEPAKGTRGGDDPKVRRFSREVHQIEAGKLLLPEYAPWLTEVETALKGFPEKEHRDFVDSLSQALAYIREDAEDDLEDDSSDDEDLGSFGDVYDDFI